MGNKSATKRTQKLVSSLLSAPVTLGSAAVPHTHRSLKHQQQRQMSPHSKSKLNAVVFEQIHPTLDPKEDTHKVGNLGVYSLPGHKAMEKSVPEKRLHLPRKYRCRVNPSLTVW